MAGIKHAIDQSANEILRAKGGSHEVSSLRELEAGEQFVETRLAEMQLESDKLDHDVLEDFLRQGVSPGEYFGSAYHPNCENCGKENDCAAGIYCFRCAMIKITSGKLPEKEGGIN